MSPVERAEVTVYCDDPYHEGEPTTVGTFQRDTHGEWRFVGGFQFIDEGDEPWGEQGEVAGHPHGGELRMRHRVECSCAFTLTARDDTLRPILSRLADQEVEQISLHALEGLARRPRGC